MTAVQQGRSTIWRSARRFIPGLATLAHYQGSWFRSDLAAGLSVAAIALPVGIAYSEIVGVPAILGMYSAIVPLLAYALFGSSRQLMTGPDAATCILVAAALAPMAAGDTERYLALMVILTLMTGVLYIVAGFARLGFIANFLSQPILTGFLNGVALVIVVGQLPKLFGYDSTVPGFFQRLIEFAAKVGNSHRPTLLLGLALLVTLIALRRFLPRLPGALVVVIIAILAVVLLGLQEQKVAVIGEISATLPAFQLPRITTREWGTLVFDAAGIMLISFTSGVLTAKSFARLNRYDIDSNQELIAFGACNIASGLAQGFPVTGADSRTAVNNNMGGKTQLVGVVAAVAMLLIVFLLSEQLALVPGTALAAVIIVAAAGLIDLPATREIYDTSHREFAISLGTTLGVLVLGVLPGVMLAVALSLLWLLAVGSRPHDAVLGRVQGMKGFHDLNDYPEAKTVPGLVLYRFDANIVFYNADYFRDRLRAVLATSPHPVEWVVVDASAVNVVDATAMHKIDELREELSARGIVLASARGKVHLGSFFKEAWWQQRRERYKDYNFDTLKGAVRAFNKRDKPVAPEPAENAADA